jgi:hypothetical protein
MSGPVEYVDFLACSRASGAALADAWDVHDREPTIRGDTRGGDAAFSVTCEPGSDGWLPIRSLDDLEQAFQGPVENYEGAFEPLVKSKNLYGRVTVGHEDSFELKHAGPEPYKAILELDALIASSRISDGASGACADQMYLMSRTA